MGRLDAIADATRPKMHGRAMLSGPSGAGKTWTSLSMAARLAADEDRADSILVIDTERESALTYADVFTFRHLPWRPPYDPTELADVLAQLGNEYAVVNIDSFSHFWRGLGGTLDIADGKYGGWKSARPVQERLVEAVLSMPCHVILCVRSKMEYLVGEDARGKQQITKVGLAPIQDETLVYEMNVALDIDLDHRITVTKSRTPAVPVGRMYPAGMEAKAADDYAGWLAGGVPPASREEVDEIVDGFAQIVDAEVRKEVKNEFVQTFGMPQSLTAGQIADARAWMAARLDGNTGEPPAEDPGPGDVPPVDPGAETCDQVPLAGEANQASDPGTPASTPEPGSGFQFQVLDEVVAHVKPMSRTTLAAELTAAGIKIEDPKKADLASMRLTLSTIIAKACGIPTETTPEPADDQSGKDVILDYGDGGALGMVDFPVRFVSAEWKTDA